MTAMGLTKEFGGANVINSNMPIIGSDSNLTMGSLALVDLAHSTLGISAVPASNDLIPNVAWEMAKLLIPAGTETTLSPTFTSNFVTAPGAGREAFIERTGKGGLHVCVTQAGAVANGRLAGIFAPTLIRDYLFSKWSTRRFALAIHSRLTRPALSVSTELWEAGIRNGSEGGMSNYLLGLNRTLPQPPVNNLALARSFPADPTTVGEQLRMVAVNAPTGIAPPASSNIIAMLCGWGATMASSTAGNKSRSSILRRVHLIDRDEAGVTEEEFFAAETRIWQERTAVGGLWYDDTFTAVTTLL